MPGFNLDQIVNDPTFMTGVGFLGAGSAHPNAMGAWQALNANRNFGETQRVNTAHIAQEAAQTGLIGQEVEQSKARTALLGRELDIKKQQFDAGMAALRQIFPEMANSIQPSQQVQPAPNAPPVSVPGPVNPQAVQKAVSTGKYGTPSTILDNLMKVESSGNPMAVGPVIPGSNERALGAYQFLPSTIKQLQAEGINFNPFDVNQSRDAADYLLQKYGGAQGDWNKAIAAYGGFKSKDPTAYITKVIGGSPEAQAAASTQLDSQQARLAQLQQQAAQARKMQQGAGLVRFMFGDNAGITDAAKAMMPDYKPEELLLTASGQQETHRHDVEQEAGAAETRRLEAQRIAMEQQKTDQALQQQKQKRQEELASMQMGHEKIASAMDRAQKQIDALITSPGLNAITGGNAITNKFAIPGQPAYSALNKLESIQSKLVNDTLQSVREGMKNNASGYGSFTEKELEVVKSYIEKLDPGDPDFVKNLRTVRETLGQIRDRSGEFLENASGGELKRRVHITKDGKDFSVPANQLADALKQGYQQAK